METAQKSTSSMSVRPDYTHNQENLDTLPNTLLTCRGNDLIANLLAAAHHPSSQHIQYDGPPQTHVVASAVEVFDLTLLWPGRQAGHAGRGKC